jgi:cytochrome c556
MKKTVAVVFFAVLGVAAAIADTHDDRSATMKANGGALKALGDAGKATPFDPAAAKAPAQTLIDNAAKIPGLFAPGTENADPAALPAIWTDQAGFAAAASKLGTDAKALQAATDGATFATALKTVQGDCGACHNAYRAKPAPKPAPAQ